MTNESLNCCGLPCRNADPESPYYCYKCHDTLRAELEQARGERDDYKRDYAAMRDEYIDLAEKVKELEQAHVLRSQLFDSEVDAHCRTVAKLARADSVVSAAAEAYYDCAQGERRDALSWALHEYEALTGPANESTDGSTRPPPKAMCDDCGHEMANHYGGDYCGAACENCKELARPEARLGGAAMQPMGVGAGETRKSPSPITAVEGSGAVHGQDNTAASSPTPKKETCDLCDEKWTRGFWDGPTLRFLCTPHDAAREQAGEGER